MPFAISEEILEEVAGHKMYTFGDGYSGYHQVKIAPKDQLKTTFTTPWETFCYTIMPFGLCNALRIFQRLMNKIFNPFLGLFLQVLIVEAVGNTLSQLDENGHDHPIHFVSRQLTSTEKNYTMTEQEGFGVIFFLKKFRHYLLGYKAKIVTDHKALTYLVNKPNPSG